jgi:hypothetical protein
MPIENLIIVFAIGIIAFLIIGHLNVSAAALRAARNATETQGLQLLDESIVLKTLKPVQIRGALLGVKRVYHFEFSSVGDRRYKGNVSFIGRKMKGVELQAYRSEENIYDTH